MSDENMETRTSRLEWELQALKDRQQSQEERMSQMTAHMDARFDQVLSALHELRDNRSREEGAAEARELDAQKRQRALRWIVAGIGLIGALAAVGWFKDAGASWLPVAAIADAPIPVQHYTREVP